VSAPLVLTFFVVVVMFLDIIEFGISMLDAARLDFVCVMRALFKFDTVGMGTLYVPFWARASRCDSTIAVS
jgi:hypothetical protein